MTTAETTGHAQLKPSNRDVSVAGATGSGGGSGDGGAGVGSGAGGGAGGADGSAGAGASTARMLKWLRETVTVFACVSTMPPILVHSEPSW